MNKPPAHSTILLLVSDQLVRAVMQETLEQGGYLVLTAGNLGAAVDRLREVPPDFTDYCTFVARTERYSAFPDCFQENQNTHQQWHASR